MLWAAAAVLALIAPFRLFYALSLQDATGGGTADVLHVRVDGWGRVHSVAQSITQHETRYGIVSVVAAGLLLAASGAALLAVVGRGRASRSGGATWAGARFWSAFLGVAATALLAATFATALLDVQSVHDNLVGQYAALNNQPADPLAAGSGTPTFEIRIGWMVWLGLIAVACALLALLLQALSQRAPAPAASPPQYAAPGPYPVDPDPGPYPDDELLDTHPKR